MGCVCVKTSKNRVEPVTDDFNQPVAPGGLANMAAGFCKNQQGCIRMPVFDMPTGYLGPQTKSNMMFASQQQQQQHKEKQPTIKTNDGIFTLSPMTSSSNGVFPLAPMTSSGQGISGITSLATSVFPFSNQRDGMIPLSPANNGLLPISDTTAKNPTKPNFILVSAAENHASKTSPITYPQDNTPPSSGVQRREDSGESPLPSMDPFQQPQIPQVFISMPPLKQTRTQGVDPMKLNPIKHMRPQSARGERIDVRPSDRIKFDPNGLLTVSLFHRPQYGWSLQSRSGNCFSFRLFVLLGLFSKM
jgi:hypothetical protein